MARIALIHAVVVAMAPIEEAFQELWPDTERVSILDDSLSVDRARNDGLTPAMTARIAALGTYSLTTGADAILYTCSAFGPAIEAFARTARVPVLKPNEAMFRAALARGRRIGMLATFGPSVASMEAEFAEMAAANGSDARIETVLVAPAMPALKAGDAVRHDALLAEAAPRLGGCDAVMLAQFSTARARDSVAATIDAPVLTSPHAAVMELKSRLARL